MPHYRDSGSPTFPDIEALANYRVRVQAPLFGDATCPAVEYTFAVSEDPSEACCNLLGGDQGSPETARAETAGLLQKSGRRMPS